MACDCAAGLLSRSTTSFYSCPNFRRSALFGFMQFWSSCGCWSRLFISLPFAPSVVAGPSTRKHKASNADSYVTSIGRFAARIVQCSRSSSVSGVLGARTNTAPPVSLYPSFLAPHVFCSPRPRKDATQPLHQPSPASRKPSILDCGTETATWFPSQEVWFHGNAAGAGIVSKDSHLLHFA